MIPAISIVLPTYNSFVEKQGSLDLMLRSLANQEIAGRLELIIVDNGSTDETWCYLQTSIPPCLRGFTTVLQCAEVGNRSKARNMGSSVATGDMVIFLDDDVILLGKQALEIALCKTAPGTFACGAKRRWMVRHWDSTAIRNEIDGIGEPYIVANSFLPKGVSRESGYRDLQEYSFLGNFGIVPICYLKQYGGFNEEEFPSRREDNELMLRLLVRGVGFSNLFDCCECIHLTHPMVSTAPDERIHYHLRFREYEQRIGFRLKANNLFGVFEGEGHDSALEVLNV